MNRWNRWLQHGWLGAGQARRVLSAQAVQGLTERIVASERRHTGEVCVCIESALPLEWVWPPLADAQMPPLLHRRALGWFGEMRVWDTQHNNGVLIYLQLLERHIEIVADRGLNDKVTPAQWSALIDGLAAHLRSGEFEAGLHVALDGVTALLEAHFPADPHRPNPNELPDAVVVV